MGKEKKGNREKHYFDKLMAYLFDSFGSKLVKCIYQTALHDCQFQRWYVATLHFSLINEQRNTIFSHTSSVNAA